MIVALAPSAFVLTLTAILCARVFLDSRQYRPKDHTNTGCGVINHAVVNNSNRERNNVR